MKTNSKNIKKQESILSKQLKRIPVKKLSKQSGFCKRKPKKIEAKKLLIAFLLSLWGSKKNTYSNWANKIGLLIGDTVSKQAVSKRVKEELVEFLKSVLKVIMKKSLSSSKSEKISEKLKKFKRVIIEDSTSIHLEEKFNKDYPGSKNQMGREYATMKIQAVYEVLRRNFLRFEITNFRNNDQGYAARILEIVKSGDLIIRDLGYFVSGVFKKLTQKRVSFISRLRKGINIYQTKEEPIDLAKMLKKRGNLDMEVFIGEKEKTLVRLIAIPVEEQLASARRRKARIKRDRRYNLSKEHLFLLGWNLLITNIPREQIETTEIAKIYSIRWRIEIIFKCWKSCLEISNIPMEANKFRLESFIYCMLIFILLFQVNYYTYYSSKLAKEEFSDNNTAISLMKFLQFIVNNISFIIYSSYLKDFSFNRLFKKQIVYYCSYESRTDRNNYNQFLYKLS